MATITYPVTLGVSTASFPSFPYIGTNFSPASSNGGSKNVTSFMKGTQIYAGSVVPSVNYYWS